MSKQFFANASYGFNHIERIANENDLTITETGTVNREGQHFLILEDEKGFIHSFF